MEQFLAEYFVNSIWQVLLLALGAWFLLQILRPSPRVQHLIWIGLLPLLLLAPILSMHSGVATRVEFSARPSPSQSVSDLAPAGPSTQVLAGDLVDILSQEDVASAASPVTEAQTPRPLQGWGTSRFHVRELQLGPVATFWVVAFYLATVMFALIRLLVGVSSARRLVARSTAPNVGHAESLLLDQCCLRLGVARPEVLQSSEVRSPMVVGIVRPTLLLPTDLFKQNSAEADPTGRKLEAVLLHELAHLRRRDCLANLACRIVALPVAYHPAIWAVRQRIRQTQELLCDAIAATEMQSPIKYARCLVGLAQSIQGSSPQIAEVYGATMFDGRILEERVMQLIGTKKTQSMRSRTIRIACGIAVVIAVLVAAATFHVTPTLAQTPSVETQAAPAQAMSGQSHPTEALVTADNPESAEQLEKATRQFDMAMAIVNERLAKSFGRSVEAERAAMEAEKHRTEAEVRIASAKEAAEIAERNAQVAQAEASSHEAELQKHLAEIQARINSPEFKKHIAEIQANFESPEFKEKIKKLAESRAKLNSPEFKKQMAEMQARLNSPEFKQKMKEMAEAQAKLSSEEFKKHMAEIQANFNSPEFKEKVKKLAEAQAKLDNPEFKKHIADMQVRINSPEFKEKIKQLNSADFQKRMAEVQSRLNSAEFQQQIAAAKARANNPEFRKQLDELNQRYRDQLQQLMRQFNSEPSLSTSPKLSPSPHAEPAPSAIP